MMRKPLTRLRPQWGRLSLREQMTILGWLPVIRVTGDVAKMMGYPMGILWRRRHAPAGTWPKRHF